jgi:hypothetical protein
VYKYVGNLGVFVGKYFIHVDNVGFSVDNSFYLLGHLLITEDTHKTLLISLLISLIFKKIIKTDSCCLVSNLRISLYKVTTKTQNQMIFTLPHDPIFPGQIQKGHRVHGARLHIMPVQQNEFVR